jgi:hypothetical protein
MIKHVFFGNCSLKGCFLSFYFWPILIVIMSTYSYKNLKLGSRENEHLLHSEVYLLFYIPWPDLGRKWGEEFRKEGITDQGFPCLSLQVYPTTMRALGMGTSGSLCRIGAMVAPFISQVRQGEGAWGWWGKRDPSAFRSRNSAAFMSFPTVRWMWIENEVMMLLPGFRSILCTAFGVWVPLEFGYCWGACKRKWDTRQKELKQLDAHGLWARYGVRFVSDWLPRWATEKQPQIAKTQRGAA